MSEWVRCPAGEAERESVYLFKFKRDAKGQLQWTGLVPEHQEVYNFGSREPLKETAPNVWECRAGDNTHGEFHSKILLLPSGELEVRAATPAALMSSVRLRPR